MRCVAILCRLFFQSLSSEFASSELSWLLEEELEGLAAISCRALRFSHKLGTSFLQLIIRQWRSVSQVHGSMAQNMFLYVFVCFCAFCLLVRVVSSLAGANSKNHLSLVLKFRHTYRKPNILPYGFVQQGFVLCHC